MRRLLAIAAFVVAGLLTALPSARANWKRAANRLAEVLESELAWSRSAADVQRGLVELDRERSSLEYSASIVQHASRESMRRLSAYRANRAERERVTRARARALYKLSRGGVARLAFEDLSGHAPSSAHRVGRALALRFVVRHDLEELSVHQRAERRATAELTAAARELQALGALTTVQALQDHVLVAAELRLAPELDALTRQRRILARKVDDRAISANRALLRTVRGQWRELRSLRGLDGAAHLVRPVEGSIVGGFGTYEDPILRLDMVRNGIELRSPPNGPVRAMADGRVVMVTRLQGFEDVVVIDHGSGQYTLTAHLWKVAVEEGDEVEAGDLLARTAPKAVDDGLGPTVYVELRHGEKPVDPSPYVRRAVRG